MAVENVRELILLAAQKLFQKNGLRNVTMEDVAAVTGKGKSTLYYYYKSKEEIFKAVLEKEIGEAILETLRQVSVKDDFFSKLQTFAMLKYHMAKKRRSLYKLTETGMDAEEWVKYTGLKREVHRYYLQKEKMILLQFVVDAMNKGEARHLEDKEIEECILVFLSSLRGINRELIVQGTQENAENLISVFCRIFVEGMK